MSETFTRRPSETNRREPSKSFPLHGDPDHAPGATLCAGSLALLNPGVNAAGDGGSSARTPPNSPITLTAALGPPPGVTLTAAPGEAFPRGQVSSDCTVTCQVIAQKGGQAAGSLSQSHTLVGARASHPGRTCTSWGSTGAPRADRKGQSLPTSLDAYVVTNYHHHTCDPRQREQSPRQKEQHPRGREQSPRQREHRPRQRSRAKENQPSRLEKRTWRLRR